MSVFEAKFRVGGGGYLDCDEFLLHRFSVGKLLSEAHVDGVVRRAPVVLPKLFQFCNGYFAELTSSAGNKQKAENGNDTDAIGRATRDSHLPLTYFPMLSSSTMVFWGSFVGWGWATLGSLVLANTWHLSCLQA